jgi:hypothetical protein
VEILVTLPQYFAACWNSEDDTGFLTAEAIEER